MREYQNIKEHIYEQLQDPEFAYAYLNLALEDDDDKVFLCALDDIAKGNGHVQEIAKKIVDTLEGKIDEIDSIVKKLDDCIKELVDRRESLVQKIDKLQFVNDCLEKNKTIS